VLLLFAPTEALSPTTAAPKKGVGLTPPKPTKEAPSSSEQLVQKNKYIKLNKI